MFGNKAHQQTTSIPVQTTPSVDGFLSAQAVSQLMQDTPATQLDMPSGQMMNTGAPEVQPPAPQADYIMTDTPAPEPTSTPDPMPTQEPALPVSTPPVVSVGMDDLAALKQQALQQLSPLVQHLEQKPEDKFRTTMMMLQSTDDQSLVKVAYEAAQNIPDEKIRAQALLDVVNEINYFTQKNSQSAQ
jgi:hypothetical protein